MRSVDNWTKSIIKINYNKDGSGFDGITDLDVGLDQYLYVLTYFGDIYKIFSKSDSIKSSNHIGLSKSPLSPSPLPVQHSSPSVSNSTLVQIVVIEGDKSYSPIPIVVKACQTIL